MTDEQTAQSILMDSRIGNDRVALKQAIVAALDAARREGFDAGKAAATNESPKIEQVKSRPC
jgi:hypothetical protein